jgi:hypothetical protein
MPGLICVYLLSYSMINFTNFYRINKIYFYNKEKAHGNTKNLRKSQRCSWR